MKHSRSLGLLLLVAMPAAGGLRAQQPRPPLTGRIPDGTVRGTFEFRRHSRDAIPAERREVTGTAHWRLETDSVDWRRKVTLRFRLAGPERAEYVIRLADAGPPRRAVVVGGVRTPRSDPRFFAARLDVNELGERRTYRRWSVGDSTFFHPVAAMDSATVLRGSFALLGYHNRRTGGSPDAPQAGPQTSRYANLVFAAVLDPRPAAVPTMTPALQGQLLRRALYEFAIAWVEARVDPPSPDSTGNSAWARALLVRRWSEGAIVDSVVATPTGFFVRMRGRTGSEVCTITHDSSGPTCETKRRWRRPFQRGPS